MSVSLKNDRRVTAFWLGMWLLLTSVLLFAANWQAENEKRERISAFETQTLDLSETAEQILISRLKHYDETLLVLRDAFVADRQSFPETIKRLRSGPLADSELLVVLVDRAGYLDYTDAPNVPARLYLGDRAYFRFFANGGKDRLYIDEPSFGRVTRRYTVPLARPIFDKNGSFLGVVAISIKQESLSNFGHGLARSADAMITVVSQSVNIVTRSRDLAGVQGTKLAPALLAKMQNDAEGVISDHAAKDVIARTIAWQNPPGQPLILFAEAYPREVLRESAQERTLMLTSASIASLLILILVLTLLQRRKVMIKFIGLQQAHLQEAQRIAGMGSWELDLSNSHFKWSDEVYRLFGLARETFDPSLENFLLRVTEADRVAVRAEIDKAIHDGEGAIEFSLLRGDGQQLQMFGRGEAVSDKAGKVTSLIGTVRDITEQRAAERALMLSEEKLRAVTDNVNSVLFMKDLDGRYLYVNRQYETMFHVNNATIQGKTDHDIFPHDYADAFIKNDQLVIHSGQPFETEEAAPHDDGIHYYLTAKFPIRDASGKIYALCGIATDITERKQTELLAEKLIRRNKVLMQNSLDGIHIMTAQGQLLEANDAFCRLLGYTQDEMKQLKLADWEAQMTPDELKTAFENLLNEGHAVFETVNRRKDGSLVDVEISAVGVEIAGEKLLYAATRDISERKRNQQQLEALVDQRTAELRTALEAAKAADKTKDAFLANITHELRTPLSAVIGFSGLARPYSTDPRQSDYLDKIASAGKTLSGIINDLLDLSKIAAGRMELEDSSFSLRQLLARCISVMSFKAEEKGLELLAQIDENIPDVLQGDSLRIEQILLNLLSNAIKFTTSGRIEVRIGLQSKVGARVCLNIEVEDSGIGLSEESIQLLFQPFSQSDSSMSRKFGGTGLGLAICKHLAELMNGEISVSSLEGSGATFCVKLWLPLGDVSELAATEQPIDHGMLPASYRDARVLVVDDQLFNREVVEGLLAVVGIAPRMADNGQEAIDQLINAGPGAFDLVLMDIQMPVMDGLTATRIIRSLEGFGQLPVIAMTAHTMAHEKMTGSAAGMSDHIGKPFDDLGFYRTLAKWLPRSKYSDQSTAIPRPALPVAGNLPAMRGIDTRGGLALFVGDEARYRHWLTNFVEEAPGYVAQIRQALASGHPEQGAPLAHILKGRGGMLGMGELVTIAAALETAIDTHAPTSELQEKATRLELIATQMIEEIIRALGFTATPAAQPEPLPVALPDGPLPQSIVRLIALLEAGDGDCDIAMTRCLEELIESAWAPRLQQAQVHVQNFDFAAARKLLCAGDGANNSKAGGYRRARRKRARR
jgi:PAS domain S-box-containing protein